MAKKQNASILKKAAEKRGDVTKTTAQGKTVGEDIKQSTSRKGKQNEASEAEKAKRKAEMNTRGRKGCKLTRINMAFTPENHYFLKVMSKYTGNTMTEFCNKVIHNYQKEHPDLMEIVKPMMEKSKEIDAMFNDED